MDDPNVNIIFFRKFQADFKENREIEGRQLLDAGPCGLNVVSGGLKTGVKSTVGTRGILTILLQFVQECSCTSSGLL